MADVIKMEFPSHNGHVFDVTAEFWEDGSILLAQDQTENMLSLDSDQVRVFYEALGEFVEKLESSRLRYLIIYDGETIDSVDTFSEAEYLVAEYNQAFGVFDVTWALDIDAG